MTLLLVTLHSATLHSVTTHRGETSLYRPLQKLNTHHKDFTATVDIFVGMPTFHIPLQITRLQPTHRVRISPGRGFIMTVPHREWEPFLQELG